jgi:hypothetical protein
MRAFGIFVGGALMGALVGLLVGLSITPVVASVVSALIGLVVAYGTATLGGGLTQALKGTTDAPAARVDVQIYLAGFSFLAIGALLVGIYLRTHGSLSPTPKEVTEQWMAAGLTREQAQQVALKALQDGGPAGTTATAARSVLIADDTTPCDRVMPDINNDQWGLVENEFRKAGGDWAKRLEQVRDLPADQRRERLREFATRSCAQRRPP